MTAELTPSFFARVYRDGIGIRKTVMDVTFLLLIAVLAAATIGLIYGFEHLRGRK